MSLRNVILSVLALAVVAVWLIWVGPFLSQDRCLDDGGSWQDGTCVGARSSP